MPPTCLAPRRARSSSAPSALTKLCAPRSRTSPRVPRHPSRLAPERPREELHMTAPEPRYDEIPDPAAAVARRPAPEMRAPRAPSPTRAERRRRLGLGLLLAVAWVVALTLKVGVRDDIGSAGVLAEL